MFNMLGWPSKQNNQNADGGGGSSLELLPKLRKPVIGVAFGAGAARGWAHIGVLNALIEADITPSVVAGTSIGAVVGGCWGAGRLTELTDFAKGLTKRRIVGLLDIHFGGSGLITGNRLRHMLETGIGDTRIEDLPIKFAAVTTEFQTGHEIWLTRGHLVTAMRASYAIPGIFEPLNIAGRWLFDGALVNPVPVSVARALGAEMVISVSLNSDHNGRGTVIQDHYVDAPPVKEGDENRPKRTLLSPFSDAAAMFGRLTRRNHGAPGMARVMVDAINITQDRISRSRLAGDPPDIALVPKLSKIGLFEFQRAEESIEIGREAANRAMPEIKDLIQSLMVPV